MCDWGCGGHTSGQWKKELKPTKVAELLGALPEWIEHADSGQLELEMGRTHCIKDGQVGVVGDRDDHIEEECSEHEGSKSQPLRDVSEQGDST